MSVLVVGAGVNELVCAHTLARAGCRVLVLQGRAGPHDLHPDAGWIPPQLVRSLALERLGLKIQYPDPWIATPLPGVGYLELSRDMARSVEAIRRVSAKDAAKWPAFCERMARLARLLETLYTAPPPDPVSREFGDLAQLAGVGLRLRRLGRQGIEDLMRLLPMSVADWLDEWFENDALKAILGAAGVMHLRHGPRSGGTAFGLLHHHVGSPAGVFRPPLSNIRRVLAELPGIEIRRDAEVAQITVREGRVGGVVLASGEEIPGSLVVSGADPRRTLLKLVDPGWLDPEVARAVRHIRCRGVTARVTLVPDHSPGFPTLAVAPSLDYLERAHDEAKHGRISRAPFLEAVSREPGADGRHRVDVHVQYAPYTLANGEWNEERRVALGDLVLKMLSQRSRDFNAAVVERVLSPRDLEATENWPEGQAHHAELALDQVLWMRPLPGWARYRMPVAGLYLCGPGTHPGAGTAGAAGRNAARAILRDLKRRTDLNRSQKQPKDGNRR